MGNQVIKYVYYIPDKNGGNFYQMFTGTGDNLPNNLERYIPSDIDIDDISDYLKENYNYDIYKGSISIVRKNSGYVPYVAYTPAQAHLIDRNEVIKQNLEQIKRYYVYKYGDQANELNNQKKYCKNS